MATLKQKIVPHLWFDQEALAAAQFYTSIFKDSRITNTTTLYDTPSGTAVVVSFELCGQAFQAISAGPYFKFNESISFIVNCDTQEEVDYFWTALTSDGGEESMCGWLIVPTALEALMQESEPEQRGRVMQTLLQMKKLDIATLERARAGD